MKRLLCIAALLLLALAAPLCAATGNLRGSITAGGVPGATVYHLDASKNPPLTVSTAADGTLSVLLNDKEVASGKPCILHATAAVTTTALVSDNDVLLSMRITNTGAAAIVNPEIQWLSVEFSSNPTGTLSCENWGNIGQWRTSFYPSSTNRLECTSATDGTLGYSGYSPSEHGTPTWTAAAWQANGVIPRRATIQLWTSRTIAPGASAVVTYVMRFTDDLSISGLYSGHKAALAGWYPQALNLRTDLRPVTRFDSAFGPAPGATAYTTNPGGFSGAWRRLDTLAGVQAYLAAVVPPAKAAGVGCIIFWDFGYQPGPWYPQASYANTQTYCAGTLPLLVKGFASQGIEVGCCCRCDGVAGNPTAEAAKLVDFGNLIKAGFTRFYLDSFPLSPADHLFLARIRQAIGPNIILAPEVTTDASARLCQMGWSDFPTAAAGQPANNSTIRVPSAVLAVLQYEDPYWAPLISCNNATQVANCRSMGGVPDVEDYQVAELLRKARN